MGNTTVLRAQFISVSIHSDCVGRADLSPGPDDGQQPAVYLCELYVCPDSTECAGILLSIQLAS